jgi:hypothetical protein
MLLGLGLGAMACTGVMDGESPPMGAGAASSAGGGGKSSGGAGASGGSNSAPNPGYKPIHRLSAYEYNATVADVLGTTMTPANGSWSVFEIGGFDNLAEVQRVKSGEYQRFFEAATSLAQEAFGRAEFKAQWLTCGTSDDACVSGIVGKLGLRLLRRPLSGAELANYKSVYGFATQQGETHEGSLQQVLRTLLSSSEFLFRMEFDPDPTSAVRHPLTSYELASRLSYLLWSSAPDDALLAAAANDSLSQDEAIKAHVNRLLADPVRSSRFVQNFYGQWLGARKVASHPVAREIYTAWSSGLADALTQEMYAYFSEFLRTDQSWLEFLTTDRNFVNAPLAAFYGMPAPTGEGLQKVTVTSDKRVGFLGLGGFLAVTSQDRRTSPTLRGRLVMINLLCQMPPPPPITGVPKLEEAAPETDLSKGNVRAVLEKHRQDPGCANCHKIFDPYGLPLEQFDAIGAYRTAYADGSLVVPDTELLDGTKLTGAGELADALTRDVRFQQCIADNLYSYGVGRPISSQDRPVLDSIKNSWSNGQQVPSIRRLLETVTLDASFRSRSGQPL